jgi:alanyl-tRNA synthetase
VIQRATSRQLVRSLKDLSEFDGKKLFEHAAASSSSSPLVWFNRDEVGLTYLSSVADAFSSAATASGRVGTSLPHVLLTSADQLEGKSGTFILVANNEDALKDKATNIGVELASLMEGKGGGRKNRFQGKGNRVDLAKKAEAFIAERIAPTPTTTAAPSS